MIFQVYLWNGWILQNDSRFQQDNGKVNIYLKSLEDFVKLSEKYDLMYSGNILHIDDKGKRFKQR